MKVPTLLLAWFVSLAFLGSSVLCQEAATATADATETETVQEAPAVTETTTEGAATDDSASALDVDAATDELKEEAVEGAAEENVAESEESVSEQAEPVKQEAETTTTEPVQSGPLIDLFGPQLLALEILDEQTGQLNAQYTNEALAGKNVIGIYFSADWCGPCRQFTPELVSFYERMNNRRGKKDQFEIVWVSRCRDMQSYANYFASMPWLALPPEDASGVMGQMLGEKYKVQGIPSLVLIDDLGQTITIDGRNKIPQDKAGIGFPWRNPFSQLYTTIFPRSLRLMVKSHIDTAKTKVFQRVKTMVGLAKKPVATSK